MIKNIKYKFGGNRREDIFVRKRPLCIATVCYISGIMMGLYLQISIVFLLCLFTIIVIITHFLFHKNCIIIYGLIILLGFISVIMIDKDYLEQYKFCQKAEEYQIEAIIVSDVTVKEYKKIYEVEIKKINGDKKYEGRRWLLNIKKSNNSELDKKNDLEFGDFIEFYGTIEIPPIARNYMGFDYQRYLKSKKIYGTIITKNNVKILKHNQSDLVEKLWYDVKNNMKEKIYKLLPENSRELCLGILVGERKDISEEISNNFRKSNLTHMLAVSGAHVSYIILGLTILLCKTRYKFRKIFMIIFLMFFMGLTGFTPSIQRASLMTILTLIAGLVHRKQDIYTNLSLSCLIILASNPYSILDIGFQLSYAGTIGIILFYEKISEEVKKKIISGYNRKNINSDNNVKKEKREILKKIISYIVDIIAVTISANLIIIPIMAVNFNTISFTFWISNLLAGPLLGFIVIFGFISYLVSLLSMSVANIIAFPLNLLIYLLIDIAKFCSEIPLSSVMIRTPFIFEILIYYFALFILYQFSYFKKKILKLVSVILIFLGLFYGVIEISNHQALQIYFVDVGQGDCTLIRTPSNKTLLVDGGGSENGNFNVGEKILLPYLLDRKITNIDYMMISHFDTDHCMRVIYNYERIKS